MTEPDLSVVVPVYNEQDNLRPLLTEIEAALQPTGLSYEVIAVDDGSRDGTRALLETLATEKPYLRVVFFRRNFGQTAAFDAGFKHARGRLLATMDADLQNDPKDIPLMLARLEKEGHDVVVGWRRNRKDGMVLRKVPSWIANAFIRRVTGTKVHDLGCSLRVYRREITEQLNLYGEMHRFISVLAEGVGARVAEMEVHHRPRHAGSSKYGLMRTLKVILDLVTVWFMHGYQTKPIYIFGGVGLGMLAVGGGFGAWSLYDKFFHDVWVHNNPLFILGVMFGLMGVQSLLTGIIAELLIRTYFESGGKRGWHVARTLGFHDSPRPAPGATAPN
ncbi:MAG: glycosyltransferase family 2 protein [Deltaproteobacteria bacterium]|nr:glycosyltransferase family 2 protein [Deltaproteobacteria bacterium]